MHTAIPIVIWQAMQAAQQEQMIEKPYVLMENA